MFGPIRFGPNAQMLDENPDNINNNKITILKYDYFSLLVMKHTCQQHLSNFLFQRLY